MEVVAVVVAAAEEASDLAVSAATTTLDVLPEIFRAIFTLTIITVCTYVPCPKEEQNAPQLPRNNSIAATTALDHSKSRAGSPNNSELTAKCHKKKWEDRSNFAPNNSKLSVSSLNLMFLIRRFQDTSEG